jgi:DNA-directed RNA polymerase subunit RPC12/RpoP
MEYPQIFGTWNPGRSAPHSWKRMKMVYDVCDCLSCGKPIVLDDLDTELGEVDCPFCGYTNMLDDIRIEIREEEW